MIIMRKARMAMEEQKFEIDKKIIERLKGNIIIKENLNLKTRTMNDQQMVSWIKKKIEEEVQCYLNQ